MKSYMLSALSSRWKSLSLEAFTQAQPHSWVVWEAGTWKPPSMQTVWVGKASTASNPALVPPPASPSKVGESLCIVLEPKPEGLTLGRAPTCDIVINDGTLSSMHLVFRHAGDGRWTVTDPGSKNGTTIERGKLIAGMSMPVRDGSQILAAQVTFTFHTPLGLWNRLKAL